MPYIDVKITTYERYNMDKYCDINSIIEKIKTDVNFYPPEISEEDGFINCEKIDEVDEYMTVEDNDGFATIEIYNDEGEVIYHNGKKEIYF